VALQAGFEICFGDSFRMSESLFCLRRLHVRLAGAVTRFAALLLVFQPAFATLRDSLEKLLCWSSWQALQVSLPTKSSGEFLADAAG
jgi:hypothetical protein